MFKSLLGTQSRTRSSDSSRHRHRRDRDDDDDSRSKSSSHSHHRKSSRHHSSSSKHKSSRSDDRDADRHSSSRRSSRRYEDDDDGARSIIAPSEIASEAPSRTLDGERSTFGDDPNDHYKERRARRRGHGDDDSMLDQDSRDPRRRERETYPEELRYRDDAPSAVGSDLRDSSRRDRDLYWGEPRQRSRDRYNDDDDDRRNRSSRRYDEPSADDRYEPATRSERRSRTLDDRAIPEGQRPIEPAGRRRTAAPGPESSRSPLYHTDTTYPLPTTSGPEGIPQSSYRYPPPTSGSYPPADSSQQPPLIGSAAEYYGDQGQSVPNQPGFTSSAISPSGPEYGPPPMPIPQFDQHEAGPSGPPPQHGTGTAALGGMAAGAAGYGINSAMSGGSPSSGPPNTSPTMPGSMPADMPSNSLPNAPSNTLPGSYHESPTNYAPSGHPDDRPQHHSSSSHGGLAALGATAGIAAAAGLAANAYHNSHHNSHGNGQQIPYSHSQQQNYNGGFQQGNLAYQRRQQGPLRKFVDFWRDPEGVALYEEYSEITGTCRYCFEPGTTSRDAPRKHNRYRRRPSNDSFGGRSRVDKLSRYGSSEEEGHHKSSNRKSWLAAGLAAYVGKSLWDKGKKDRRDRSPSIRRPKSSSSSSVGGRGAPSYGQTTVSEYSHPPSTIGGGQKLDRYGSRSDVSKPSMSAHSRSKSEGHRRRDRSRSSSSDSKSGRSGLKTAAIAAGALGTAAAMSSASHARKERRVRAGNRSRSPRKSRRRYSSSSSSSMIDISRPSANKGLASFSNFFSAPSEKSRMGRTGPRKKQRNLFGLGSTYSSSDDADLAFGSGFLKSRTPKKGKGRKRDEDIDHKLIGLGATAAGLAASASIANGRKHHGLIAVKERKSKHEAPTDNVWESVSDESSSADSGLAYGGPSSNSRDSFTSDSGTSKWRWRWGSSKKKKKVSQPLEYPNKQDGYGRNSQASFAPPSSTYSLPSMQNVDPIPASEQSSTPYRDGRNSTGGPSAFDTTKPMLISHSENTELGQPKPVAPISDSFYTQGDHAIKKPKPTFKEIAPAVAGTVAGAALIGTAHEYYNDHPLKDSKGPATADVSKPKDISSAQSNREQHDSYSDAGPVQHRQNQIMPPPPVSLPGKPDQGPLADNVKVDRSRKARDDSDISMKKAERRRRNSSPALEDHYTYVTPSDLSKRSSAGKGVHFDLTKEQQDKEMRQLELEGEKAARRYQRDEEPASDPESRISKSKRLHRPEISPPLPDEKFEEPLSDKDAESWSMPARVAFPVLSGAAAVAADRIIDEKKRKREERRKERRGYSESEAGSSAVSRQRFDSPDRRFVEEPGELTEKPLPNPKTKPTYENYATYFAPPELRRESSAESAPESTPVPKPGAAKFRVIEPRSSPLDTELTRAESTKRTNLPWPVPHLNLIEPTPPQSRTGSVLSHSGETKDLPVADPIVTVPEQAAAQEDRDDTTHDSVRNKKAGHIAASEPPLSGVPGAAKKLSSDGDMEVIPSKAGTRELPPSPEIPSPPHHMPGEFGDDIDFAATLAAGTAMSGFDPSIVTDNPAYHRRASPPRSEGGHRDMQKEAPVSYAHHVSEQEPLPLASKEEVQAVPARQIEESPSEARQGTFARDMQDLPSKDADSSPAPETTAAKLSKKDRKKQKAAQKKSRDTGEKDLELDWEEQPAITPSKSAEADRKVRSDNINEPKAASRDLFDVDDKQNKAYRDLSSKGMVNEREEVPGNDRETWQDAEEDIRPRDSSTKPVDISSPAREFGGQLPDNKPHTSMPGDFEDVWADIGPVGGKDKPSVPADKGPADEPELATAEKSKKKSKGKSKQGTADEPSSVASETAGPSTHKIEIDEPVDRNVESSTATSVPDIVGLERGKSKSKRRSKRYAELIDSRSEVGDTSKPDDDNVSVVSRAKSEAAKDSAKGSDKSRGFFGLFGSSSSADKKSSTHERDRSPPPSEVSTSSKKKKSKKDRHADEDAIKADDNDLPASRDIEPVNADDADIDNQQRQKSKDRKKDRKNRYEQIVESGKASDDEDKNRYDTSRQAKNDTLEKEQPPGPFLDDSPGITSVPAATLEQAPTAAAEKAFDSVSAPISTFPLPLNLPSRGRSRSVTPLPGEKIVDLPTQSHSRPSSRSRSPPGTAKRISWRGGFNFGDPNSSPTAIPIQLRRPPSTPDRGAHDGQVSPSRPKSGHKRPKSTEFKTNREFRPLWLVERHTSKTELPEEETYPSLPSSKSTSRMSSVEDLRAKALEDNESMDIFSTPRRRPSLHVATNDSSFDVDILGSQQATPTAHSFRPQDRKPKEKPKYEFHSPSELLEGPMSSRSALSDVPQSSDGTVIPDNRVQELEVTDLQNLPPLPESPVHEDPKSRELDITPEVNQDVQSTSYREPEVEAAEIPAETRSETISLEHLPPLPDSRPSTPTAEQGEETEELVEDIDRSSTPRPTHRELDEFPANIPAMISAVPDSGHATPTQLSPTYRASEASEYESVDEDHFVDASSQAPMSPSYQKDFNSPITPTQLADDSEPHGAVTLLPPATAVSAYGVPDEGSISKDTDSESVMTVTKDDSFGGELKPSAGSINDSELELPSEKAKEPDDMTEVPAPSKSKKNKKKKKKNLDAEPTSAAQSVEPEVRPVAEPAPESAAEPVSGNQTVEKAPLNISTDTTSSTATDQVPSEEPAFSTGIGEESSLVSVKEDPVAGPVANKPKKGKNKKGRKNKSAIDSVEGPSQESNESSASISTRKDNFAITQDEGLGNPTREVAGAQLDDMVIDSVPDIHSQLQHARPGIVDAIPPMANLPDTEKDPKEDTVSGEVSAEDVPLPVADLEEIDALNFVLDEQEPTAATMAQINDHPKDNSASLPLSPEQNPQDIPLPLPSAEEADLLETTNESSANEPALLDSISSVTGPSFPHEPPVTEVAPRLADTDIHKIESEDRGQHEDPEPAAGGDASHESNFPTTTGHGQLLPKLKEDIVPTPFSANLVDEKGIHSGTDMFFDAARDGDALAKHELPDELADKEPEPYTPAIKSEELAEPEPKQKKKKGKKGKKDRKNSASLDNIEASASTEQPLAESLEVPVRSNETEEAPAAARNEETVEQPSIEEGSLCAKGAEALPLSTNDDANAAEPGGIANDTPPHIPGDNSSQDVRSTSKQSKKQKKKDKKKQALLDSTLDETVPEASNVEEETEKSTLAVHDKTTATEESGQDQPVDKAIVTPVLFEEPKGALVDIPVDEEPPKEDTLLTGAKLEVPTQVDVRDERAVEEDSNISKATEGSEAMRFNLPREEAKLQAETIPSTGETAVKPAKAKKDKKGKKGKKNREVPSLKDEDQSLEKTKPADGQSSMTLEAEPSTLGSPPAEEKPTEPVGGLPMDANDVPVETHVENALTSKERKKRKKNRSVSTIDEAQPAQKSSPPDVPEVDTEAQGSVQLEVQDDHQNTEVSEPLAEAPSVVDKLLTEPEPIETLHEQGLANDNIPMDSQASEQVAEQPLGVDGSRMGYQPLEPSTRTASEINDTLEGPQALEAHKNENLQETDPRSLESSTLHQPLPFESTPQPSVEEPSGTIEESPAPADKPGVSEPPGEKPANSDELPMEASGDKSLQAKGKKKKNRSQSQSLDKEPQAVESSSLIQQSSIETPRDGPSDPDKDESAEQRDDEPLETLGNSEVNVQQDMLTEPLGDKLRSVDVPSSEVPVDTPLAPKEKKKKRKKKGQSISIDEEPKATESRAPVNDLGADPLKDVPKETLRDVEAQEDLHVDKHLQTREEETPRPQNVGHQDTEPPAPIEDSSAQTLQDMPSESQPYENMALVEDTPVDSGSSKTQQGGPTDILQDRQPETQQTGDSHSIEGEPSTTLQDKRPEVTESAEGEQPKSIPSDVLELEPKDIIDENQQEPKLSDPRGPLPAEPTDDKRLDAHHVSIQEEQEAAPVVPHEVQEQSQIESSEPKVESAELEDDSCLKPQSDQPAENQKGDAVESHEEQSTDIVDTASVEPPIELTSTPKDKKKKKKKKGQPKALDDDTEVIETLTTVDQLPADTVDQPVPETPIEKPLTAKEKKKLKKHQKKLSLEQESQPVPTPGVVDTPSVETQKEQDLEVDTSLPYSADTHAKQPLLDQGIEKDQETPHLEELPIPKEAGQPSETLAAKPSTQEPLAIGNDLPEQHIDKPLTAKERKEKRQEKATTSLEDEPVAKEESVSRESALDDAFSTEPVPEEQTPEKPLSAKEKKKKKKKSQEDQAAGEEFSAKPEEAPETSESTSVEFLTQEAQDVDNTRAEAPLEQPLTAKEKKKGKKGKKSKQSVGWTDELPQTPQGVEIPRECETEASIPTESTATTAVISSAEPSQENIEGKSQGPKEQPTDVASTQPGMVEMDIGRTDPRMTEPQGDGGEVETGNPDEDGKEFQLSKSQKKNKSKKKAEVSCWTDEIPPTQVDNGPAIPPTDLESQQRSLPFDEEPLTQPDTATNASDALRNDALDNLPAPDADLAVSESKPSHSLTNVDGQPEDATIVEEKLMETPVNDATRPDMVSLPESVGETTEQHLAPEKTREGIKPSMEIQSTGPGPSLDDQIMENIQESATENPADESLSDKSKGLSSTGLGDALTEPSIPELQDQSTPIPPSISLSSRPDAEGRLVDLRGAGASVDTTYSEPIKDQEIQVSKYETKNPETGPIDFTISEKICEHPPPEQFQAEISDAMQETPTELPKPEEHGLALLSTEQSPADDNDSAATPLNRHTTDDVLLRTIPQLPTVSDELPARDTSQMSKKEKKKKKKKGVVLEGEPAVAPELPDIKMQTLPEEPSAPESLIADMKEEPLRTLSKKEQKAAKKKARGAAADVVKSGFKEDVEAVNSTPNVPKITADITETTDFNKVDDAPTTEEPEVGIEKTHGLETQPISTVMTVDSAGKDMVTLPIPPFVDDNITEPEPVGAAAEISHKPTWDEGSGPRKKSKKQKERTKGTITSQTETDVPGELKDPELEIQLVREEPAQQPVLSGQSSKRNKKKKKKDVRGLSCDVEAQAAEEKEIEAHTIDAPVCPDVDMPVAGEAASPKEDEVWPTIDWDHIHDNVSNTVPYAQVNNEREMDTASLDLQLSGDHEVINDTPEIQHTVLPKTMTPGIGDFSEDTALKGDDLPEEKPVETFAGETGQKPKGESMSEIHDTRAPQSAAETLVSGGGAVEERGPDQDVPFGEKIDANVVPTSHQTSQNVIDSAMEIDRGFKEDSQPVAMESAAADDSTNKDLPMKDLGAEPSVEQTTSGFHDAKEPAMALSQETQGTEPTLDTGASPVETENPPQLADKGETAVPYDISIGPLQGENTWSSTEGKGEKVKKSKKSKGKGKALEKDKAETETPLFETQELQAPSTAKHEMTESVEPATGLTLKQPEEEAVPSKEKGKSKAKGLVGEDLGWTEATDIGSQDLAIPQQDPLDSPDPLSELVPEFESGPSTKPPPEDESAFLTTDEKENKPKNKKNEKPAVVETEQPENLPPPISVLEPKIPTEVTATTPNAAREEALEPEAEFLPNVTKRKGKKTKAKGKRPGNVESTIEAGERHSEVTRELSREPEELVKSNEPSFLSTTGPGGGPEEDISPSVTSKNVKKNKKKNKMQLSEDLVADTTKTQLLTPEPEHANKRASLESLEAPDWPRKHEPHPGDDKAARQGTGTSEDLTISQALDIGAPGNETSGADMKPVNQAPEDVQVLDKSMAEPEAMIPTPKREYNDDPFSVESSSKERSSALLFHSSPSTRDFGYMTPATHEIHDQREERPSTPTPMHLHKSIETDKPLDHADDTTPHALLSTPEKEISGPTTAKNIAPKATEQARPSLEPPSLFGGPYGLAERERSVSRSVSPPKTPLGTIEEHSAISAPYEAQNPPAFPPLTPDAAPASRGPEKKQQAQPQTWATPAVNPVYTPESTPPKLRRVKSRRSSDLKAASERDFRRGRTRTPSPSLSQEEQEYQEDEEARQLPSSSTYDPVTDKGKAPLRGMAADVYEGWGDVQGAPPLSPTRPPSVRRRRSLQRLQELETRLDQLVSENRLLGSSKAAAEKAIESHAVAQRQHARALEARDQTIQNKELEIQQLQKSSDWLKKEITRLTEVNEGLAAANASYAASRGLDGGNQSNYKEEWEKSQRELEKVRAQYAQLSSGLEQMVKHEVGTALADKDAEIQLLRDNLADAQDKIKELQEQIQASAKDDILVFHDEDYFDNACQKLCQHVQQWVLRFSKFSDMRVCRTTSVLRDEKIVDRFENAILDGTDVDTYLSDRVGRRDVFMSVAMTMMWEYIFTRYLFGMDREQRQKLKTLEKHLSEVGPPNAVHKWRATTLTLLSKRPSFKELRSQDTEAVVQEIYRTLSKLLPPPHELEKTVLDSLRNVMRSAVDLSIKMRTQRAEYIMLPPLQPEYDTNGELLRKVYFNAALMNERSGETTSNEELEAQRAVVRMVLFPLVVKKGSDEGDGDEEIVVCPAQVLVARPPKERKSSKGLSADRQSIRSTQSFPSISMAPSNPSNIM
ncbi:TPA_exp: Involucrin repeat protein [Trichophyton benhamiae CBS 112371]|uniref:Involucrin repeat protein n=1 Tax=Arthroderma benhamiae (strain ATCC MYA-4681 / CBS 112371) TaxID=663331 RepID=D4AU86_ARTBC|nr:involucrin repeat protein [Trichophyton benhamiae CBS 112371]EFE33356.1 involucrin repeat protein [Trichophyton benhamiae CBS 112371]DAA76398.1 TPA_exp: Involucrin repeat protein [Trichophyton benhamiae CBS 112371]